MQIEDVARICLASRRTAQGQRHLTIRNSLLGQVIIDDQHVATVIFGARRLAVLAGVDEVLAHCSTSHRSDVLQRSGVGSIRRNNDGLVHDAVLLERLHNACNRGSLLTDCNIDADDIGVFLVDDGVNRDSGLAGLAVADDQLALTASDGHHGVDGNDAGLHGLMNGLAANNAGSLEFDGAGAFGLNGAFAVDRHAKGVHNAAEQALAGGNLHDLAGGTNLVVFSNCGDIAEKNGADFVFFEVLSKTVDDLAADADELQELACHGALQTIDAGNTVAYLDDRTDLTDIDTGLKRIQLLAQCFVDRLCGDFCH